MTLFFYKTKYNQQFIVKYNYYMGINLSLQISDKTMCGNYINFSIN